MSTPDRDRAYHHGALRAELVATARRLLEAGGLEAVTLRAVAREAGVSAMAPYRHFQDKAALLAVVAAEGFAELRDRLAQADHGAPDPSTALAAQGVAYVEFARAHPGLFRLMFEGERPALPELVEAGGAAYAVMAERVASLAPAEDRAELCVATWSVVHGLAALILAGRIAAASGDPEALTRRVTRVFARLVAGAAGG